MPARSVLLGAALAGALSGGCSGALYSTVDFRQGQALHAGAPALSRTKADVLAALGPPSEVLPLAEGDVFIYRRSVTDLDMLNLNTGIFTGITLPLYARIEGHRRDDLLWVQFDAAGRVTAGSGGAP